MCLRAFYKLDRDLTVSLPPSNFSAIWQLQLAGFFDFWNAVLSTNFGSTGRLHYFSAVHKVRAHASYMGVTHYSRNGDLDWNKLYENIYAFANSHGMRTEEFDTNYVGGQVATYQLEENSEVYYELRHSKPREDHGSNFRVYSRTSGELEIKVKSRLLGNPSIKSNIELTGKMEQLLKELSKRIGTFKWVTEQHHLGWPKELGNTNVLRFECKRIDLAHEHLEPIRQIHLKLLENNSV